MSEDEQSDHEYKIKPHRNTGKMRSVVWDHFSVIDRKNYIAECNTCHGRLSFKTTVTNLKKHVERKHPSNMLRFDEERSTLQNGGKREGVRKRKQIASAIWKYQNEHRPRDSVEVKKSRLTDLGGLEGLILNVIGEDGEDITDEANQEENNEENQDDVYTIQEVHDYDAAENSQREQSQSKSQRKEDYASKVRRSRIMELQLECLEIKKYNMQLEALMLEQQLSIRRSIFTEPLRYSDTMTKGTQTDVGGENTRVFYLADGKGGMPRRHLFAAMDEVE